ncbi:MAG: PAS domain-containing sensor histidine kinase, partial [Nitriliruptorales bacterium]|nr:PAS domain-containing sensor histidine kinase [Nitriliruptorales bacterium]
MSERQERDPADSSRELDRSEERFRLLVESVVDYAIFVLDPDGRIRTWNPGAERLKGYTEDEIVGQHYSVFYPDEYREENLPERLLAEAREQGRVEHSGWRVRKDGSRFWADVVITALWEDEELAGYAKVTRDMTEAHEAQQQREAALRRLEELDQWRRDFISAVTHDLRSPVVSILGFVRLLRQGGLSDEEVADFHERILSNTLTMNALLEHLRTQAMLESGEITLEFEPLELAQFTRDLVADMEPVLGGHEVEVAVDGVRAMADRRGVERILRNLLSNAARHTPPAG